VHQYRVLDTVPAEHNTFNHLTHHCKALTITGPVCVDVLFTFSYELLEFQLNDYLEQYIMFH